MDRLDDIKRLRDHAIFRVESWNEEDQLGTIIPSLLRDEMTLEPLFVWPNMTDENIQAIWKSVREDKDSVQILAQTLKSYFWDVLLEEGEINLMVD